MDKQLLNEKNHNLRERRDSDRDNVRKETEREQE